MVNWPQWLLYFQKSIRLDWNWNTHPICSAILSVYNTYPYPYTIHRQNFNLYNKNKGVCMDRIMVIYTTSIRIENLHRNYICCAVRHNTLQCFLSEWWQCCKVQRILNKRKIWNFPLNKRLGDCMWYYKWKLRMRDSSSNEEKNVQIELILLFGFDKKVLCRTYIAVAKCFLLLLLFLEINQLFAQTGGILVINFVSCAFWMFDKMLGVDNGGKTRLFLLINYVYLTVLYGFVCCMNNEICGRVI